MSRGQFRLTAFNEKGGVQRTAQSLRLVCVMESGGRLAIWGSESNRRNIDLVLNNGLPCTVECDYREPSPWGKELGHTHWVPEDRLLRVMG